MLVKNGHSRNLYCPVRVEDKNSSWHVCLKIFTKMHNNSFLIFCSQNKVVDEKPITNCGKVVHLING